MRPKGAVPSAPSLLSVESLLGEDGTPKCKFFGHSRLIPQYNKLRRFYSLYTPLELYDELNSLIVNKITDPVLIMGESGVGKSQIIRQLTDKHGMTMTDIRWGQLGPADARGVPAIDRETRSTEFFSPSFWPRTGPGIIFLDEFNMASPVMMGLAQQLLLDRKFGNYSVPPDVLVWAAGNRKVDRGFVNEIPAPVKNRVAHYQVAHDLNSWEIWAFSRGIDSRIIGFLKWRPELLHKFNLDSEEDAWPSPRTWEMADRRLKVGMSLQPVVGACALEFDAFVKMSEILPDLAAIAAGRGSSLAFPDEPSMQFAAVSGLVHMGLKEWEQYKNCFIWLSRAAKQSPEWIQMFVMDVMKVLSRDDKRKASKYMEGLNAMPEAARFIDEYVQSIVASRG